MGIKNAVKANLSPIFLLFNDNNKLIGMITLRKKNNTGNVEECFAYAIPALRILKSYYCI